MDPAKQKSYKVNNFELTLKLVDSGLLIKAEHLHNFNSFSSILSNEYVRELTSSQFEGCEELLEAFLDALNNPDSESKLTLDDQALLTYYCTFMMLKKKREFKFTIQLCLENPTDPVQDLGQKLTRLSKKVADIEEQISSGRRDDDSSFEKRVTERLNVLEEFQRASEQRYNSLEKNIASFEKRINERFNALQEAQNAPEKRYNNLMNMIDEFSVQLISFEKKVLEKITKIVDESIEEKFSQLTKKIAISTRQTLRWKWDASKKSSAIILSEDNTLITKNSEKVNCCSAICGDQALNTGVHKWLLKVSTPNNANGQWVIFGIYCTDLKVNWENFAYQYAIGFSTFNQPYQMKSINSFKYSEGTTYECVLDFENDRFYITSSGTIICQKKGIKGKTYYPFCILYSRGNSVKLSFT